jgi:hypothetical protein
MFLSACSGGLFIGDATDGGAGAGGGPTTSGGGSGPMPAGPGGAGGGTTGGGGGSTLTEGAGGATMAGGAGGAGGADPNPLGECSAWTNGPALSEVKLNGAAIDRVWDAWGLSDSDYYVAVSSSTLGAVVHFDGQTYKTILELPSTPRITSLTGAVGLQNPLLVSQLSVLAPANNEAAITRSMGPLAMGSWIHESLAGIANGLVALGEQDALLSVTSPMNIAFGEVLRWNGTQWAAMDVPALDVPYSIRKLRMLDSTHVYGIGYSGGADMGSNVFAAFDGSQWRARRVPAECGNLDDVVGVPPDRIYTLGSVFSISRRRVCRVSPDLATWTVIDEYSDPGKGEEPALVATSAGTLLTVLGTYMISGPSTVRAIFNDHAYSTCTLSPGLGFFVAWSAPRSPKVHLFAGPQVGQTTPVRHLVATVDPLPG